MEKERGIIIVGAGNINAQTFHNLAMNNEGKLVHINQNKAFEQEPIHFHAPPIIENKIHYDKYGKILTNKGSKFHK